jgi:dCTP deaminase
MILTSAAIDEEVANGGIIIHPYRSSQLNPNSYNYRLGPKLRVVHASTSLGADASSDPAIEIEPGGAMLTPGKVYLGHTAEIIGSAKYVVSLMGRSSVGRLGLFLQLSADLGNLGPAHQWTLELTCVQPIILYPDMLIGQVTFWQPHGEISHYTGLYADFSEPTGNLRGRMVQDHDFDRT